MNKNSLWPSRETNSHYMRPITFSSPNITFGSTLTNSAPGFGQPSTPSMFGQQQAQLWSRFRFAASTLRDNLWMEQTDSTLQQVPSNIFTTNQTNNPFNLTDQTSLISSPQTVPTRLMTFQPKTMEESPSSLLIQRKITPITDSTSFQPVKEEIITRQSSVSKLFFIFTIFLIGLVFGYLLTDPLPVSFVWETCVNYFHLLYVYLQTVIKFFSTFLLAN